MSSSEWREVQISDVCNVRRGSSPRPIKNFLGDKGMPWVKIADATAERGRFINRTKQYIREEGVPKSVIVEPGTLIVSNSGTAGLPKFMGIQACVHDGWLVLTGLHDILPTYLYYQILYIRRILLHNANDSVMKNLTIDMIKQSKVNLPPIDEQKRISEILTNLDNRIENNDLIIKKLYEIAQTIFKLWFVDFEFKNEDGQPYKSSGGMMVESEFGMIPAGWQVDDLGNMIELHDSKRIPISKLEREKRKGEYPYYGAASLMDYVDDYIFDGVYVLLGEDGSVIDKFGYPILQYVWGKLWVNNHAHVITGVNGYSQEYIYMLLSNINVRDIITGAVQLKINQKNLKSKKVVHPSLDVIKRYSSLIESLFARVQVATEESETLTKTREILLQKLMSGEIRIEA